MLAVEYRLTFTSKILFKHMLRIIKVILSVHLIGDPDDLFSMPSEAGSTGQKAPPSKGGLFDGSDEEEDLFDTTTSKTTVVTRRKEVITASNTGNQLL